SFANNSTPANGYYWSSGNATLPYVTNFSGASASSLQPGDNVLAVEVHNYKTATGANPSPDVTFGLALLFTAPASTGPKAPFITNVVATAGETTATITWTTLSNSTSRVMYGLNGNFNESSPLDSTLVTNHSVTLSGLAQLTN